MKNFGSIIRHYRTLSNMSMASLAEGICTKHYIYLIENGKRMPSIRIIDELSAKLNFDWRDYLDYAKSESPIEAKKLIDEIEGYYNKCETDKMCERLNNLPEEKFLLSYPVNIEIWLYKLSVSMCYKKEKIDNIEEVKSGFYDFVIPLTERHEYTSMPLLYLKSINIYALILQKEEKLSRAANIYKKLIKSIEAKKHIPRYMNLYINIYHNYIFYNRKIKEYNKMRQYSLTLIRFQEENNIVGKLPITFILLGDAYKSMKKFTIAYKYYKRAIAISGLIKNKNYREKAELRISHLY